MAARGARSRKEVERVIEKQDARRYADRFNSLHKTADPARIASPVAGWRRKPSINTGSASIWSAESGSSFDKGSGSGARRVAQKLSSIVPREEEKYLANGRSSAAPRGRGGGVPLKNAEAAYDRARTRSVKAGRYIQSSTELKPVSLSTRQSEDSSSLRPWATTKLWTGGMEPLNSFKGFEHDDDMWMADGDCLIFFAEETSDEDPRPMCKIHAKTLEQARSVFMINLLKYGEIIGDEDEITANIDSAQHHHAGWPLADSAKITDGPGSIASQFASRNTTITWDSGKSTEYSSQYGIKSSAPSSMFPIPQQLDRPSTITHEIWFRAPSHITRPDIQRRHHLATRNYIALLYGLPIVGSDLYEMLSDLQNVMDTYYELNDPSERWNSAQVLITYIKSRKLDDVRGNLSACLGLMAWAEQPLVLWEAGYLEGFVHAVGMMNSKTTDLREFKLLSQISRHKLQNAYNASQLRLIEAEERLSNFAFAELWYAEGVASNQPAQRAYNEFRSFLSCFYATVWGNWPPKDKDHQKHWLSRTVVNRLQADLGALYDYIVDREVSWDASEERHTRKWQMVSNAGLHAASFSSDFAGLPVTSMLVGFDSSMRYEHIPHPYPILPTTTSSSKVKALKKGLFGRKGSARDEPAIAGPKEQFQMALAFNAATNVEFLGAAMKDNRLIDTFQHHEKSFSPSIIPPAEARLGRWILLYAILQVLSTLSVDVGGLKYAGKIRYFANPSLEGMPPWKSSNTSRRPSNYRSTASAFESANMHDATQAMSYCWQTQLNWPRRETEEPAAAPTDLRPTSAKPPAYEEPPPDDARLEENSTITMPIRSVSKASNIPNPAGSETEQEGPPRTTLGPRLFPTIAPVGKLAEQRHAFPRNVHTKISHPLRHDSGNAFASDPSRRMI